MALLGMLLVILAGLPSGSRAQEASPVPAEPVEAAQLPEAEHLAPPLLDQMLAPVALYPDALLSQILMASTYPLEVIEAYRWVSDPANAALKGADLEAALETQDWDPSVKSLVPFPDILKLMDEKLGWMQQVGNAFLSQPQDVMDSVQRLRNQAAAAGNLKTTEQQRVVTEDRVIVIQPASPQVVYVPVYDPYVVYGTWPWPTYPPVYFSPFPRYGIHFGLFTWFSFGIVNLYWGWNHFDWHHHHIRIDHHRYNRIWRHHDRPRYSRDYWEHDPYHRRGVAYTDPRLRTRFRPNPQGTPASRTDYRGYPPQVARAGQPAAPASPVVRPTQPARPQPAAPRDEPVAPREEPGTAARPGRTTPPARSTTPADRTREPPAAPARDTRPSRVTEPPRADADGRTRTSRVTEPRPAVEPDRATRARRDTETRSPARSDVTPPRDTEMRRETARVPPVFESYGTGDSVRVARERAQSCRQSAPSARMPSTRPERTERTERSRPGPEQKRQR